MFNKSCDYYDILCQSFEIPSRSRNFIENKYVNKTFKKSLTQATVTRYPDKYRYNVLVIVDQLIIYMLKI